MTASVRSFEEGRSYLRGGSGSVGGGSLAGSFQTPLAPLSAQLQQGPVYLGPSLASIDRRHQGAVGEFNQALGNESDYDFSEGDKGQVTTSLHSIGQGRPQGAEDVIRGYTQMSYDGPSGLDTDLVTELHGQASDHSDLYGQLYRGKEPTTLGYLKTLHPGLTTGEARSTARNLPGTFFGESLNQQGQAAKLGKSILTSATDSARQALERGTLADNSRAAARSFIEDEYTRIGGVVENRRDARAGQNADMAALFAGLGENPFNRRLLEQAGISGEAEGVRGAPGVQSRINAESRQRGFNEQHRNLIDWGYTTRTGIGPRGHEEIFVTDPITGQEIKLGDENAQMSPHMRENLEQIRVWASGSGDLAPGGVYAAGLGGGYPTWESMYNMTDPMNPTLANTITPEEDRVTDWIAQELGYPDPLVGDMTDPWTAPEISLNSGWLPQHTLAYQQNSADQAHIQDQFMGERANQRQDWYSEDGPYGSVRDRQTGRAPTYEDVVQDWIEPELFEPDPYWSTPYAPSSGSPRARYF